MPTPMPASSAAAAPVSDSSLVPCTAKDICLLMISGPIAPASRPSSAAASTACCTKS
ncbi:Uncharacterised protein [Mycobacteroides abscessus subsp. abscessus]|nr:Uncharacterised protein [Mycobacteroides abscessus subsp. abscessus]